MDRDSTLLAYYSDPAEPVRAPELARNVAPPRERPGNTRDERPRPARAQDLPHLILPKPDDHRTARQYTASPEPLSATSQQQQRRLAPSPDFRSGPRPRNAPSPTSPLARDRERATPPPRIEMTDLPPRAAFVGPPSAVSSIPGSPMASLPGTPMSEKKLMHWNSIDSEDTGLAGPENDRMAGLATKDMDFWRRFSMVVHAAEAQPRTQKQSSGWLSKETRSSRTFQISIWLSAIVILAAIGGGLAYHFTHDNSNSNSGPTTYNLGITPVTYASTAASAQVIPIGAPVGAGGGQAAGPTPAPTKKGSSSKRMIHRRSPT